MATTQFLAFGTGAGANTLSYAGYSALAATVLSTGFLPGIANSEQMNTALRQVSTGVAGLARFAVDWGNVDMLDTGDVNAFAAGIKAAIDALVASGGGLKPGAVVAYAGATPPLGWLECNGSPVSRSGFPGLFTAIGTAWGAGDGSTTFNLPDLRGEFLRGWDHGRGIDADRLLGSAQAEAFKAHRHLNGMANDVGHGQVYVYGITSDGMPGSASGNIADDLGSAQIQGYTSTDGGTETRPRNAAVMYCIKT